MKLFRKHTGRGQYKDICWWVYELEKPVGGYTHVYCMPYAITEEMMSVAASGKTKRDATTPDIDRRGTGNIHPSGEVVAAASEDLKIRQLVLCVWHENLRQFGPALKEGMVCDGTVYHNLKSDVPAANYYPMITKTDGLTEEEQEKQETLQHVTRLCIYNIGIAVDESLFMPRIRECRYYSGEREGGAPFQTERLNWFWRMERVYVNHLGEKFIGEGDYYEALGGKAYPGIPKDLLYMMFSYWAKGVWGVAESLPKFYKLIDEYLEIASDHFPKDKIPGDKLTY